MVADDEFVGAGEFEDGVVSGAHADFGVAIEDMGFSFEWSERGIGDGVGDAIG